MNRTIITAIFLNCLLSSGSSRYSKAFWHTDMGYSRETNDHVDMIELTSRIGKIASGNAFAMTFCSGGWLNIQGSMKKSSWNRLTN